MAFPKIQLRNKAGFTLVVNVDPWTRSLKIRCCDGFSKPEYRPFEPYRKPQQVSKANNLWLRRTMRVREVGKMDSYLRQKGLLLWHWVPTIVFRWTTASPSEGWLTRVSAVDAEYLFGVKGRSSGYSGKARLLYGERSADREPHGTQSMCQSRTDGVQGNPTV